VLGLDSRGGRAGGTGPVLGRGVRGARLGGAEAEKGQSNGQPDSGAPRGGTAN
jgi:hypothetical protein